MTEVGRSQVVVVGAGPAGCAAGIGLARAGVDVVVLDRARFPRDKTCGDAISNHAVELLADLGCREQLDAPERHDGGRDRARGARRRGRELTPRMEP